MKPITIAIISCIFSVTGYAQTNNILPAAKTIIIDSANFKDVCNWLLDHQFEIKSKDADLGTVETKWQHFAEEKIYISLIIRVTNNGQCIVEGFWKVFGGYYGNLVIPIENYTGKRKRAMYRNARAAFSLMRLTAVGIAGGRPLVYQ